MDIAELRVKKFKLESKISELILEFEKETKINISAIEYEKLEYIRSLNMMPEASGIVIHIKIDI